MSIEIRPNPATAGSVTGGLTYKGSYNANTNTPDLTSSVKGDFYIVSVAGTLAGVTLNVGDHIVFNQDASSPITSAMFDVIDNTDAVSSVNGETGIVVLDLQDINDVNATLTPSDSTFLVGDGSEWIGESGATARTSLGLGSAATEDVGTGANNVVQLDASSRLPAVDGSQLTNLPGGGGSVPTTTAVSQGTDYTISTSTGIEEIFFITPTADINVNLPAASTAGDGYKYNIKNLASGFTLTIDPNSTETIDGATTFAISTQYQSITIVSDGSNWFII